MGREGDITMYPTMLTTRDRLEAYGATGLADHELLATLIGQGLSDDQASTIARTLFRCFDGWLGLQRASMAALCAIPGIGLARAAVLKAALDVGRRQLAEGLPERLQVTSPRVLAPLLQLEMGALDHEEFRVVMLNTRNEVLGMATVAVGCVNQVPIRIAEVFREPIRRMATSIILCHNHPTQEVTPSAPDILLTKQVIQAGAILEVEVLDHLIVSQTRFTSLRERRLGWDH
jgi:DNA repair protein RadC